MTALLALIGLYALRETMRSAAETHAEIARELSLAEPMKRRDLDAALKE